MIANGVNDAPPAAGARSMEIDHEMDDKENEDPRDTSSPRTIKVSRAPSTRQVLVEVAISPVPNVSEERKISVQPEVPVIDDAVHSKPAPALPSQALPPPSTKRKKGKMRRTQTAVTPGFTQRRKVFDSDDSDMEISPVKSLKPEKDGMVVLPPKHEVIQNLPPPPPSEISIKTAKKARGRPRKIDNEGASKGPVIEKLSAASTQPAAIRNDEVEPQHMLQPHELLAAVGVSMLSDIPADDAEPKEQTKTSSKSLPSTPELAKEGPKAGLHIPNGKAKTNAKAAHSPIGKSQVPLRVGLSRRSRIAPLLKMVKK
jgi:hypothetical protein